MLLSRLWLMRARIPGGDRNFFTRAAGMLRASAVSAHRLRESHSTAWGAAKHRHFKRTNVHQIHATTARTTPIV